MSPKTPDTAASFAGVQISGPHEPMAVYVVHIDGKRRTILIPLDALREGVDGIVGGLADRSKYTYEYWFRPKSVPISIVRWRWVYIFAAVLIGALAYWFGAVVMR